MVSLAVLSCLALALIAFFDFKDRSIPVVLLIAELLIVGSYFVDQNNSWYFVLVGINVLLAILQIGLIATFLKIRKKSSSFFSDAFGWGDLVMMIIAALFFSPYYYIWFVIVAAMVSLGFVGFTKVLKRKGQTVLIPLAGIMAAMLVVVQVLYQVGISFL